ncbi:MAG: mechanosensitive ion channel family protein [Nitrospinae bacterium]|nr:mechanosensitive ion channel family protein [Nitrospinota bacterium]
MSRKIVCHFFIFVISLFLSSAAYAADVASIETAETEDWAIVLRDTALYLEGNEKNPARTQEYLVLVRQVRSRADKAKANFQKDLQQSERLLRAIGPPPAKGGPPEAREIAEKREMYNRQAVVARARMADADLAIIRATELEETLSRERLERFLGDMSRRTPIPIAPGVLAKGVPEIAAEVRRILGSPFDWFAKLPPGVSGTAVLLPGIVVLILGVGFGWVIRRSVLNMFGRDPEMLEPSYARRFSAAIVEGVGNSILPVAVLAALYLWVTRPGALVSGLFGEALTSFLLAMSFFCVVVAFAKSLLSPEQPTWRFTEQSAENAQSAYRLIFMLAAVFSLDMFFSNLQREGAVSAEAVFVYSAVFGTLGGWFFLKLGREELWRTEAARKSEIPQQRQTWRFISRIARVLAIIGIAALFVGYGALGKRLLTNLIWTGLLLWIVVLLRGFIHELVSLSTKSESIQDKLHFPSRVLERFQSWGRVIVDPVVFLCGILIVVPVWGVPPDDLFRWTLKTLSGFQVGSIRVSIIDIFLAIAVFFIAMAGARFLQRQLSERFLEQTNLPTGIRHSLNAGFGYAGVIVAALLSISVTGIDLSNLALVVSALSVGIGFGLQNVVNNFISGLILLVERPIKVGDWVRVGSDEGIVKRIQFRATELETWQRASVIIPNAEIISTSVTNLTHRDRYGRVEIGVGVAYGSDVEKVREILLDIAEKNGRVSNDPAPTVVFRDFGASSLDFELRCFTSDVMRRLGVASDLRFEIESRLREEGIEIPFPQRVVHLMNPQADDQEPES